MLFEARVVSAVTGKAGHWGSIKCNVWLEFATGFPTNNTDTVTHVWKTHKPKRARLESVDFYNFSASLKQLVSVINPICFKLKFSYYLHRQLAHTWKWNAAKRLKLKSRCKVMRTDEDVISSCQILFLWLCLLECASWRNTKEKEENPFLTFLECCILVTQVACSMSACARNREEDKGQHILPFWVSKERKRDTAGEALACNQYTHIH